MALDAGSQFKTLRILDYKDGPVQNSSNNAMTMTMKTEALVLHQIKGSFSFETIRLDALRPTEALVQIHASGICHTDLSIADGTITATAPAVLGHEGGGVVEQVGSQVKHVIPGDKVLLSFSHCQECAQCKDGHPAYCYSFMPLNFGGKRLDGSTVMKQDTQDSKALFSGFFGQSSFARYAIVSTSSLVKVPPDTDLALFAPLGCGLQTGAGAVLNALDVKVGKSLAVFGTGSVGLSAIMAAKMRGANPIIAIDVQQSRLDLASELGATHTLLGNDVELVSKIKKISPHNGVDYAVDCSGVTSVVDNMVHCLGNRGHATSVGAPSPGEKITIDVATHLICGRRYSGCCEGDAIPSEMIPFLMKEHAKGNYPVDKLVSYYDFRDYQRALDDTKRGAAVKAVLVWKECVDAQQHTSQGTGPPS
ncbi:hypothetical protein E4U25_004241 [Claviceps purpurea]|nr:hypothetical protein E4U25_004241 [Claviceps purpurea]